MLRVDGVWTRAWTTEAGPGDGRLAIVWRDTSVRAVRLVLRANLRAASLAGD